MTYEELQVALLELVGRPVTIDGLLAGSPFPVVGLEGVLIQARDAIVDPSGDQQSMALRVRPEGSQDTAYVHVSRGAFEGASWVDWEGERTLRITFFGLHVLLRPKGG